MFKNPMTFASCLLFIFTLMSRFSMAGEKYSAPLPPGQTVTPKHLLVFADEPDHYFFIGEHQQTGHHVFEVQGDLVIERFLSARSTDYFDGSLVLYLDDGSRLTIPKSSSQSISLPDQTRSAITYLNRPREMLSPVNIVKENLESLNILGLVNTAFFDVAPRESEPQPNVADYGFITEPDQATLVRIVLFNKDEEGNSISTFEQRNKIKAMLAGIPKGQVYILDNAQSLPVYVDTFLVLLDPIQVNWFLTQLHSIKHILVEPFSSIHSNARVFTSIVNVLEADGPIEPKISALQSLTNTGFGQAVLSNDQRSILVKAIARTIRDLDFPFAHILKAVVTELRAGVVLPRDHSMDWAEAAAYIQEHARPLVQTHPLFQRFGPPLQNAIKQAFLLLHSIGTAEAIREVLMLAGAGNNIGLDLINFSVPSGGNYLDAWLSWMTEAINEANAMTAEDFAEYSPEGWVGKQNSGGIFRTLKTTGNQTLWSREKGSVLGYYDIDELTAYGFIQLGLSVDAKAAKKKITHFIISNEITVAHQLAKENAKNPKKRVTGNILLSSIFKKLIYAPSLFNDRAEFSKDYYYGNVLDIFIELIET